MIEIFIHHIIDIDQHNAHEVLHVGLAHELETQTQLHQGQTVRVLDAPDGPCLAMADGKAIALATVDNGEVKPQRVFNL